MPSYNDLRPESDFQERDYERVFPEMTNAERIRTIENLLMLKQGLDRDIPPRRTNENLVVGCWNIKEFGHTTQRLPEAYFYIAEILERFDLIAVQEIKSTLGGLDKIMRLLGRDWAYLITDVPGGDAANKERSGYIFNKKRVDMSGLAGELTLWKKLTSTSELKQLKRTPFMTGFIAGWKRFAMINLHLHPGDDPDDVALRKQEVSLLLAALEDKDDRLWSENLIICGDMNMYASKDAATIQMFTDAGYGEAINLKDVDTNASQSEAYDRMFLSDNSYFKLAADAMRDTKNAGVFNIFEHVYRDEQALMYKPEMVKVYSGDLQKLEEEKKRFSYYNVHWRRNQISDHFPIWIELSIDDSAQFLAKNQSEIAVS